MRTRSRTLTPRMLEAFCRVRLEGRLDTAFLETLRAHLDGLLASRTVPVYRGRWIDVDVMAASTGLAPELLRSVRPHLQPLCDAISRAVADPPRRTSPSKATASSAVGMSPGSSRPEQATLARVEPAPDPAPPQPSGTACADPLSFPAAFRLQLARHGDTLRRLYAALSASGPCPCPATLSLWSRGGAKPSSAASLAALAAIERRYGLPAGYFEVRIQSPDRVRTPGGFVAIPRAERRRLAWHLPTDFAGRSASEQEEILAWVREVVIRGSTDYRRFQAAAVKQRYALRFPDVMLAAATAGAVAGAARASSLVEAPERLRREMAELLRFKTATLTALGLRRSGVWNAETAAQKVEHFALMFGALVAAPDGEIGGYGADLGSLSLAMLVFPAVWDWYLAWREKRRGFYTMWEADMLAIVLSLVKVETGWLRQTPRLADHLVPVPGPISAEEVAAARADWNAACDAMHRHGRGRIREVTRVSRVHRDPFEPILPILEAASPLTEYRRITEEIVRLMPDERLHPRAAAEAVRAFLMLRFGLHLGLRQRNLRELLVCPRGRVPTSERRLADLRRGELRWSTREGGWEVLIPAVAFKNARSSFFGAKPFQLVLPDLGGLYGMIEAWIERHRARLLGPADDPGTFFVKTTKRTSTNAAYDQTTFYEAWRFAIQRYGIHNPYTGRGAIKGLLPHGPHNVRDVLATHILKQTGSYEQASYAIQDTPEMVAKHYGRFLPQDKAAIAARILNQVWAAA